MKNVLLSTSLTILLTCNITFLVYAQEDPTGMTTVIPPSPSAQAFQKFGDYPVGNFTGVPDITIPIFTIKEAGMEVPISLKYHASGVKVYDPNGLCGTGWVLDAGPMISRTIMDKPDEIYSEPVPLKFADDIDPQIDVDYLEELYKYNDGECDIFSYSLNSEYGKFILKRDSSKDRTAILFPYKPIKISAHISDPIIEYLDVFDQEGVHYRFGESFDGTRTGRGFCDAGVNSWNIMDIISPVDTTDDIKFEYAVGPIERNNSETDILTTDDLYGSNYDLGWCGQSPNYIMDNLPYDFDEESVESDEPYTVYFPSTITFRGGSVQFMQDPYTHMLSKIMIYNSEGELIKWAQLTIDAAVPGEYRAFLRSVKFYSGDNQLIDEYNFGYKDEQQAFPLNYYKGIDYWGYYNGYTNADLLPHWSYVSYRPTGEVLYTGDANRNANASTMDMYALDTITYPTGGYTVFDYETNKYFYAGNIVNAGGLRVSKITNYSNDNLIASVKTYKYGDFECGYGKMDVYPLEKYFEYSQEGVLETEEYAVANGTFRQRIFSSEPFVDIAPHGSPVVYPTVTEYVGDGTENTGKVVYTYAYTPENYNTYNSNGSEDYGGDGPIMYKFFINPVNDWTSGQLLSKNIYKNVNGQYTLVASTANVYQDTIRDSIRGFYMYPYAVFIQDPCGPVEGDEVDYDEYAYGGGLLGSAFNYADYYIESGERRLESSTTIKDGVSITTDYTYGNPDLLKPTMTTTTNSKGQQTVTHITYPLSYNIVGTPSNDIAKGIQNLQRQHIVSTPVEQYTQKSDVGGGNLKTVSARLNTYMRSLPLLSTLYGWDSPNPSTSFSPVEINGSSTIMDANYKQHISFDKYDNRGNILQFHKEDGIEHAYLWDYDSIYPIASITNALQSDVAYTSFESDGDGNWNIPTGGATTAYAITGGSCYNLASAGSMGITKSNLSSSETYIISYWTRNGSSYSISGTQGSVIKGKTISGWTYYEHHVTGVNAISIGGSGYIDELRLYPSNAKMTTYTYKPLVGMTSTCAPDNTIQYYKYDGFGRLTRITNEDGMILKQYDYKYQVGATQ